MSFSNDLYDDYFYSQDNIQNQEIINFEEIFISKYRTDNQNNPQKFNSIDSSSGKQNSSGNLRRIKKRIQKKLYQMSNKPGETKNIPKNFACVMKKFIQTILSRTKDKALKSFQKCRDWIKFKHIPHDEIKKNQIELFLQTPFGKLIGRQFFGNCLWSSYFISENKTDVALYYRYNMEYFQQTFKIQSTSSKPKKTPLIKQQ